jgi:tRNA (guanine-N7-)-methyltransferase
MIADAIARRPASLLSGSLAEKRHHKRRLLQAPFAALAARKLAVGGYLHAATDWPDYALQMDEVLSANPSFQKRDPQQRPMTKFERRGIGLGHPVRDLLFVRKE